MKRQQIKEATRYKIAWCWDVPAPTSPLDLCDAIDAMHNAQAMYLKYVHGVKYRGPGEMFAEAVGENVRIYMRWAGTKNQAHRLGRYDPAFHAVGEEPGPMMVGEVMTGTIDGDLHVPPIPASEPEPDPIPADVVVDTATDAPPPVDAATTAADPEMGLEMQPPPEVQWPKDVFSLRKLAQARGIDTSDIKGKGSRKRIIKRLESASGSKSETQTP